MPEFLIEVKLGFVRAENAKKAAESALASLAQAAQSGGSVRVVAYASEYDNRGEAMDLPVRTQSMPPAEDDPAAALDPNEVDQLARQIATEDAERIFKRFPKGSPQFDAAVRDLLPHARDEARRRLLLGRREG